MNTHFILISVENSNARRICERIEATIVENDVDNEINELLGVDYEMYPISDYMDMLNNQEINIENYFVTYIYIK